MRHREMQMSDDTPDDMVLGTDSTTVIIRQNLVKEGRRVGRLFLCQRGCIQKKSFPSSDWVSNPIVYKTYVKFDRGHPVVW